MVGIVIEFRQKGLATWGVTKQITSTFFDTPSIRWVSTDVTAMTYVTIYADD